MSKSFMILVALLAVSSIASATEMKSFTLGFYENQERFFPIESFTGTSGCTYNFGELDVKDVNAPFPRYISPHNMVKVGTDALKRIEINVTNMRTVCRNNNCSVYTFDSDGKIYSRFGNLTTNGSWLVEGDRNLSALKEIETDKFVDLVNSNNVTFTVSHTADNNTRFILGLAPGDSTFDADETNFIVSGVVPDSDIEYIKHAGVDRTLLLLEKGGKATYITVINFQERASAQTPKPTPIDAKTLGLTTIYALEADQYVQELLYVFADSAIIAYNVSDVTNWKVVVMTNITITPEAAAKGPNLIERKANVLALRCGGNSSVLIFDTSKPTILTITGFLSTEGANEYDIDFSDRLNYLYISRPGDEGKVKLTIYDMRRLSTPQNAVNAKRFEAQFNVSTYSPKLTIMSVANLDDSSDMIFWYGVVGDIYKFYDIAGVNIIVGDETEILDQVTLTTGPRPGSYVYNYSFIATPIACQTTTDYNITISLEFLLPMRQLIAVKEKVNSTAQSIYPGVFFNGPTQTLLVLPNEDEKYKDNFKVEIINPLETKTDIVRLWNPTTDILVDEFTERGRAFLLLKSTPINGATVKADMEYRIINVNMTREVDDVQYTLNQSGSAWDDVEACFDLFAMKDIHDAHAFVLSCTLKSNSSLQGIFTYTNVSSDFLNGTQDLHYSEFQTGLNSYSPFAVDLDSNVLFQVFDSDENNGIFAASTFITLPGITNETNYTVKYSDIEGPNGEKVTQASIVNFDVVQFDNDNNFHFGLAATTHDYKLILAFVGANGTSDAQVYDLTQTSIFKQDVIFEKPFFNKVEWVNDDCLKNNHHSATLLLISPNFYSYTVKLALGADKKPTLQVINAFAYFPAYRTVDAKYDSCTNTFVTLTNAAEKFTTPNCFMSVYPSNVTNASTFSFNSESYTIIEPVSYRNLPCPDILKAKTLGSERINNITVISFSTNGEVASVQATLAFELQIKNISLPANLTNVTFALDVTAINSFSTAQTAIQYPFGKQTPTPTPTPDPDPTPTPTPDPNPNPNPTPNPNPNPSPDNNDKKSSLTWLWILLGIVGVILVIAAVVWVLRNRKDNEEALLDGKNDMSLQHA